jgi:hypothetical protein
MSAEEGHDRFKQLCALANTGTLGPVEWGDLKRHLSSCGDCPQLLEQYGRLGREGMLWLAASRGLLPGPENWNSTLTRRLLFDRIRSELAAGSQAKPVASHRVPSLSPSLWWSRLARPALAVCLLACAFGVYKIERLSATHRKVARSTAQAALAELRAQKGSDDELIEKQTSELTRLRDESSERKQELDGLRSELHGFEGRSNELVEQNGKVEDSLRLASAQRDALGSKLRETEQAYQDLQSQISSLRAERDHAVAETASLEGRISELSAANHDQERTIREDEQFLASDRDIRELMGARKLYIADVFDVDSGSHTRKPFGRVFYTQNKSLIFYAFDLDRQPGFKDASTFQVWGQKDTAQGQIARPTDLGILYLDSATNRRWVLRLDDPRQLAQIDAVFVTVEPHGGSQKPTSKPFLYALLRKEANHP